MALGGGSMAQRNEGMAPRPITVMDSSVIPLQFLQSMRFPFFGSLTIRLVFQSTGISSSSHISLKISLMVSVMTSPPAFSISALTPSAPSAFSDFMLSIADSTSFAVGGSMLTSTSSSLSGMSSTSLCASFLGMVSQRCLFF